jgi:hypothetical protein
MTGPIGFTATLKSDEVATGRVATLNVLVKRGAAWKLLHAQNMTLAPPETESLPWVLYAKGGERQHTDHARMPLVR